MASPLSHQQTFQLLWSRLWLRVLETARSAPIAKVLARTMAVDRHLVALGHRLDPVEVMQHVAFEYLPRTLAALEAVDVAPAEHHVVFLAVAVETMVRDEIGFAVCEIAINFDQFIADE